MSYLHLLQLYEEDNCQPLVYVPRKANIFPAIHMGSQRLLSFTPIDLLQLEGRRAEQKIKRKYLYLKSRPNGSYSQKIVVQKSRDRAAGNAQVLVKHDIVSCR